MLQIHVVGEISATMKTARLFLPHSFSWLHFSCASSAANAQKVEDLLAAFPNFSIFRLLLISTGIINEVDIRSSLTLLMPDNAVLKFYGMSYIPLARELSAEADRPQLGC